MGMSVREEPIHLEALSTYDGFFITSTSINMLPVTRIDELIKPVPEVVEHLRNAYDAYLSAL
jgi:branched-subunit amino acid aminotransferase/4-amino-4-deoxychorismate lyase